MEFSRIYKAGHTYVLAVPKRLRAGYEPGGKVAIVRREDGALVIRPLEAVLAPGAIDGE